MENVVYSICTWLYWGAARRFFPGSGGLKRLRLAEIRPFDSGVVFVRYEQEVKETAE